MPATYKDIQKITGFSLSTISRYFNGYNVKPKIRKSIEEAAEQLDFKMNDFARGLRSRKSKTIGLLIPNLDSMFSATIMNYVGRFLRQEGYGCYVCDCNSDNITEMKAMDFYLSKSVDGIITIPFGPKSLYFENPRIRNIPMVFINRSNPEFETDSVILNNFEAGRKASSYLLSKGHKNTAILASTSRFIAIPERMKGYISTFKEAGMENETRIIRSNNTIADGYNIIKELFSQKNDITAIFCTNYEITLGAFAAMNEMGIRFPRDISFIGFDNLQLIEAIRPLITIIEQPMEQMAYKAVELLLKRLKAGSDHPYETVVLDAKLVEGESVADLR